MEWSVESIDAVADSDVERSLMSRLQSPMMSSTCSWVYVNAVADSNALHKI